MPTTTTQLRAEAKRLIKQGAAELEKQQSDPTRHHRTIKKTNARTGQVIQTTRVKVRKPRWQDERDYLTHYGEARDLLLKHGYERELNPRVQKLYEDLIPDSKLFREFEKTCLKLLSSPHKQKRAEAAKRLSSESRRGSYEFTPLAGLELRDPKTVHAMIQTLDRETECKIQRDLVIALGSTYDRYLKDQRIFPALFPLYDADDKEVRAFAIGLTRAFPNREKWKRILALLDPKENVSIIDAALRHVHPASYRPKVPRHIKRKLQPALLGLRKRKGIRKLDNAIFRATLNTLEPETFDDFKSLVKNERDFVKALQQWSKTQKMYAEPEEQVMLKHVLKL